MLVITNILAVKEGGVRVAIPAPACIQTSAVLCCVALPSYDPYPAFISLAHPMPGPPLTKNRITRLEACWELPTPSDSYLANILVITSIMVATDIPAVSPSYYIRHD